VSFAQKPMIDVKVQTLGTGIPLTGTNAHAGTDPLLPLRMVRAHMHGLLPLFMSL
jgi:hypothetical protein